MELDVLASMRTGHGWYSLEEVRIHVQLVHTTPFGEPVSGVDIKQTQIKDVIH